MSARVCVRACVCVCVCVCAIKVKINVTAPNITSYTSRHDIVQNIHSYLNLLSTMCPAIHQVFDLILKSLSLSSEVNSLTPGCLNNHTASFHRVESV